MIRARDLSILTLAVCMYMVSNYVMMPIEDIFGVPSVVLVVGLFLGILRGYSKYLLYGLSILSSIPQMYLTYEKNLIINRAVLEIYIRKLTEIPPTTTEVYEPDIFVLFFFRVFLILIFLYSVKYFYNNYKKVFSNIKLILIVISLPIFLVMLPYIIAFPSMLYLNLNIKNVFLDANFDKLVWISAILVVARMVVVLTLGPIYGYLIFKNIGLYKRLGLE